MSCPHALYDLDRAVAALKEAQISLNVALREAYPAGTEILVKIGNARLPVRVTGHGSSWAHPGDVIGTNLATGRRRKFHHSAILGMAG